MEQKNPILATQELIRSVLSFIENTPWKDMYCARLNTLLEKADFPCELAIAGRVKAGKSSFLNALLGDDLAMVGTTETTATINFFKYGRPLDARHPVRVVWDDGREEWQTRQFLDSLQGNTKEVLDRAKKIDHLEYFVDNPILHNVTLVDTPGTGALVDEHEQRTNDYLSVEREALRKKHNDQSVLLKDRADAVIVITERVPTSETDKLIANFNAGTSAFNSLGVMTKIDMEDVALADWNRRCDEYASMLKQQLNTIVPVSAGLYRAVTTLHEDNRLPFMQEMLRRIPNGDGLFEELVSQATIFLSDEESVTELFDSFNLSLQDRKSLVGNLDWRVFYSIARELYYNELGVAYQKLIDYSGMERVRNLLERQFFNRSRAIRCMKIITEVHSMLDEIVNRRLYDSRFESNNRENYLKIISSATADKTLKDSFKKFVERNICTKEQYKHYEEEIQRLLRSVEELQQSFNGTDKNAEALMLLEKKSRSFRPTEIEELEKLFGKYGDMSNTYERSYVAKRQALWRSRSQQTNDNDVRKIIQTAIYAYGTLKL